MTGLRWDETGGKRAERLHNTVQVKRELVTVIHLITEEQDEHHRGLAGKV